MKIEPNIIDENVEKEGLYNEEMIVTLQERLNTINYQIESLNMQLGENDNFTNIEEKTRLMAEKSRLEEERKEVEQELAKAKEQKEEPDLESAEAFKGSLDGVEPPDEETEELFSARSIGKATVPKALTTDKKKARKVEEEFIKSDKDVRQINDEFKEQADYMTSRIDDFF